MSVHREEDLFCGGASVLTVSSLAARNKFVRVSNVSEDWKARRESVSVSFLKASVMFTHSSKSPTTNRNTKLNYHFDCIIPDFGGMDVVV